mmetsp:Transcript_121689/g.355595  ORF Transcript_121689/g.355595 Transcript_121689/m.355595 type:complete len:212 (-) Transcript_121689:71-706(-)
MGPSRLAVRPWSLRPCSIPLAWASWPPPACTACSWPGRSSSSRRSTWPGTGSRCMKCVRCSSTPSQSPRLAAAPCSSSCSSRGKQRLPGSPGATGPPYSCTMSSRCSCRGWTTLAELSSGRGCLASCRWPAACWCSTCSASSRAGSRHPLLTCRSWRCPRCYWRSPCRTSTPLTTSAKTPGTQASLSRACFSYGTWSSCLRAAALRSGPWC